MKKIISLLISEIDDVKDDEIGFER